MPSHRNIEGPREFREKVSYERLMGNPELAAWLKKAVFYSTLGEIQDGVFRYTGHNISHTMAGYLIDKLGGQRTKAIVPNLKGQKFIQDRIKVDQIKKLAKEGKTKGEICKIVGIHCTVLGRFIKRFRIEGLAD